MVLRKVLSFFFLSQTSSPTLYENELIAPQRTAHGLEPCQLKTLGLEEVKNFIRLRNFERISANPVNEVGKVRHSTRFLKMAVTIEGIAVTDQDVRSKASNGEKRTYAGEDQWTPDYSLAIAFLDRLPDVRVHTLFVVESNKYGALLVHNIKEVIERLPHISCMVQYTPGIDHVKLSQAGEVFSIKHATLLDRPIPGIREKPLLQLLGTSHTVGIVVK